MGDSYHVDQKRALIAKPKIVTISISHIRLYFCRCLCPAPRRCLVVVLLGSRASQSLT